MLLDHILKPRAVAVVGASTRPHTIGNDLLKRLLEYGFKGHIYPVNPKGGEIEGLRAYTSVNELPDGVDLAVIVVNAKFVLSTVDECAARGIKGLVVISAGFKETGAEGRELEEALAAKVRANGMRMVGPNCLGVVNTNPNVRLDACFAESLPVAGDIGFVSQSGALGGGILNILKDLNVGFAQFISIGNQADVNAETALEYWENDPDVKQILLYMESIPDPANFRKLATRISREKAHRCAQSRPLGRRCFSGLFAHGLPRRRRPRRRRALKAVRRHPRNVAQRPLLHRQSVRQLPDSEGRPRGDRHQFRRSRHHGDRCGL